MSDEVGGPGSTPPVAPGHVWVNGSLQRTSAAAEALVADADYLRLAAAAMPVPLADLLAYASASADVPRPNRLVIEAFLRADPDCTLAEMLSDRARFDAAASQLQRVS